MQTLSDIYYLTKRNLVRYLRIPQLLVFSTVQPVMFLMLFTYVFGGAIKTPGGLPYIDFLLPGILLQTVIFGSIQTGVGLADDLAKGVMDRFRSLPISPAAVVAGRTLADICRNIFVVGLMVGVGYIIGFRFQGTTGGALGALGLALMLGFAFSWISINIALFMKDSETAQVAGFVWVFPLVFASSIFVPIATMPHWLELFARNSPITVTADAVRALALGQPVGDHILQSLLWAANILVAFIALATYRFRRM